MPRPACAPRGRASGFAVEQRRAVERREQPLVRVDHERVGDARRRRSADARRRREQRGAAVGAVDVEPHAAHRGRSPTPARSSTIPAFVVPAVATTAHTSDRDRLDRTTPGRARQPAVVGRRPRCVSTSRMRSGVRDRRVRLRRSTATADAPGRAVAVACHSRRTASAERLAADPPDTKQPPAPAGRPARSARNAQRLVLRVHRPRRLEPRDARSATTHDTTMSNSSDAFVGAAGMNDRNRRAVGRDDRGREDLLEDAQHRAGSLPRARSGRRHVRRGDRAREAAVERDGIEA